MSCLLPSFDGSSAPTPPPALKIGTAVQPFGPQEQSKSWRSGASTSLTVRPKDQRFELRVHQVELLPRLGPSTHFASKSVSSAHTFFFFAKLCACFALFLPSQALRICAPRGLSSESLSLLSSFASARPISAATMAWIRSLSYAMP